MNRRFFLLLVVAAGLLAYQGCTGSSNPVYPLNPVADYYCMSLTLTPASGSVQATLNYSGTIDDKADHPRVALNAAGNTIRIDSSTAKDFFMEQDVAVILYGWLAGASGPPYEGTYSGSGSAGWPDLYLLVWERGTSYGYHPSGGACSITISSFGAEGGDVVGTISGTFSAMGAGSSTLGASVDVVGTFRLVRLGSAYFS